MLNNKNKNKKKESQDENTWEGYEPDHKDLIAIEEAHAQWMKDHPDWTDEDAADYYGEIQSDIARGK
tara:strand:- start:341 stop:541 length:201 start_codon:yes stop_codon:yes gene_type:complete